MRRRTLSHLDAALLDELVPLLDPTALPRVLGRAAAHRRGYNPNMIAHRLTTGQWRRILPRTYLSVDTLTWPDRLTAALTFAGPGALLSGAAALADEGLRAVGRTSAILVLVPVSTRLRSTAWVRIRPTQRLPERAVLPGPARAPLSRAVADLALERRRLDEVTVGAWSAPEARAARVLRCAGVPPFEQNVRIDLPGGRFFVVDFLWRELKAILEIDSVEHHFDAPDRDATMDRHLVLETLGYSVVHRSPAVVQKQPAAFAGGIAAWLAARATGLRG